MAYENRIYLGWEETADFLGMDSEGLRQAMRYKFSPDIPDAEHPWLPVMLIAPGDGFMTSLEYARINWSRTPAFSWNSQDTLYDNVEKPNRTELTFSDGASLQLHSEIGQDGWSAHHDYGAGWGQTFAVWGHTLTVSPEAVRNACEQEGRIGGLGIAPRAWCAEGFPNDMYFVVVPCGNSLYQESPENLFKSGLFQREDVVRIAEFMERKRTKTVSDDKPLDTRERVTLLRIIRALDAMQNLPKRGAAVALQRQLALLGFSSGPKDSTIRKHLDAARSLEPDSEPQ